MAKKLVAYFSASGVTKKVAEIVSEADNSDLYEITPKVPYTKSDLNWMDKKSRSSVEMSDKKIRPEIAGDEINPQDYDEILIGFPVWWYVAPTIINTFLEKYDFSGKTVIPFGTSGGSSIAGSVRQLQKLYPEIGWKEGRLCNGGTRQAGEWAKQVLK